MKLRLPGGSPLLQRPKSRQPRWLSYSYLLINTLFWGAALIIVKPAFEVTTPFRFLFYRYVIAVVLTLPLLWHYLQPGRLPRQPRLMTQLGRVVGLEMIGTVLALGVLYLGLARTTAVQASLLMTTSPIFITLVGMWRLRERQEKHEWLGLALAFGGTVWLAITPLLLGMGSLGTLTMAVLLGNGLVLLNNVFTAGYFVSAKPHYMGWPKFFVTTISFYVGAVAFGLLSLLELGGDPAQWWQLVRTDLAAPSVWIASGYMALFGSIIGLTAYIKGQEGVETSEASLFWYLQPLVYLPLGVVLLGEQITIWQIAALVVILVGVGVAERRHK